MNNPNTRSFVVLGDPQLKYVCYTLVYTAYGLTGIRSCGGATDTVSVMLGGEQTVTETTTVDANIGVDLEGITIGGGAESSSSSSNTVSKTISYTVPPGRQAVYVAGTAQQSQTGNVQVNYADRQFDHFIVRVSSKKS